MMITAIKGILFAALLIYAAVGDIKRRVVDDWVWISILIVSLIGTGGSFGGAVLTLLPFFIAAMFRIERMGGGDVKLMGACGAVLGIWGGAAQTIIGLSVAVLFGFAIKLTKRKRWKEIAIPLVPFLCAGGIVSYIISNIGGF